MRSKNTRTVLHLNTRVINAVKAEAEATGFSSADIVNRALLAQGYGALVELQKPKAAEKPFDNKIQWRGESDHEYNERLAVQSDGRDDTSDKMARGKARVLARYNARGMPAIIFDDE